MQHIVSKVKKPCKEEEFRDKEKHWRKIHRRVSWIIRNSSSLLDYGKWKKKAVISYSGEILEDSLRAGRGRTSSPTFIARFFAERAAIIADPRSFVNARTFSSETQFRGTDRAPRNHYRILGGNVSAAARPSRGLPIGDRSFEISAE